MKQGDTVLLKKRKDNKLSTAYEKEPYTVLFRYGDQVILQPFQGVQYRRNVQRIKPFYFPDKGDQAEIKDPELASSLSEPALETEAFSPWVPVQMQKHPLAVTRQPLATNSEPPGIPVQRPEQPPATRNLERVRRRSKALDAYVLY